MEAMVVTPAGGVMGVMGVTVVADATVADVIRCRQVTAKDVGVKVERAVTAARLTVKHGTA